MIADGEIAEFRRVQLPLHGMATRPVAARRGADVERHADAVAGVVTGAAHLGEVPAGSEIARAPFRIGLEAAAGEHHRFGAQFAHVAMLAHAHAFDAVAVEQQIEPARRIADVDAALFRRRGEHIDQARAAADGFDGEPAPELELALDLERLAAIDRNEPHALVAHPVERVEALGDEQLDQIGIGAVLRNPRHVVIELVGGVSAEIGGFDLGRRKIGDQRLDVVDAVIDDADRARGEAAVAAGFFLGRRFAHDDAGAGFLCRQRRAERRIAGTDHDHIRNLIWHFLAPLLTVIIRESG